MRKPERRITRPIRHYKWLISGGAVATAAFFVVMLPMSALGDTGSQWTIYEQTTLPNGNLNFYPAGHGTTLVMPDATSSSPTFVNYMLLTYSTPITDGQTMTATFTVTATSGTAVFLGDTFGGTNSAAPAYVRLFFQSNLPVGNSGSSCVGIGSNVNNYWWADAASYTFTPMTAGTAGDTATITLTESLSSTAAWSNICGQPASSNPGAFDQSLASVKYVGLSFGSGFFFASGVGVEDGASATFTVNGLSITP